MPFPKTTTGGAGGIFSWEATAPSCPYKVPEEEQEAAGWHFHTVKRTRNRFIPDWLWQHVTCNRNMFHDALLETFFFILCFCNPILPWSFSNPVVLCGSLAGNLNT